MKSIAVLVPSRGRPENIARLIDAWRATDAFSNLVVCVDADDDTLDGYRSVWEERNGDDLGELRVGPRLRLGGTLNHYAPQLAAEYDVVGFMGDDHLPRTQWWDRQIATAMQPLGVVYGNDVIRGEGLASAAFLDATIINTLGFMIVPGGIHLFFDDFWMAIGRALGTLTYLPDTIIEHLHPIGGEVAWDEGYKEVNSGPVWDHDEAIFKAYVTNQLANDVARLRGF